MTVTEAVPHFVVNQFMPVVGEVRAVVGGSDEPAVGVDHRSTAAPAVQPAAGVERSAELVRGVRRGQGHDDRRVRARADLLEGHVIDALPSPGIGERRVHLDRKVAAVDRDALFDLDRVADRAAGRGRRKNHGHGDEYAVANQPGPARVSCEARRGAPVWARRAGRWRRRGSPVGGRDSAWRGRGGWRGSGPHRGAFTAGRACDEEEDCREHHHRAGRPRAHRATSPGWHRVLRVYSVRPEPSWRTSTEG
jgi:hypothetical protein